MRLEKECGRVALRDATHRWLAHVRRQVHLVEAARDLTIRPAREGIAGIDNHLILVIGNDWSKSVRHAAVLTLQSSQTVLKEQRDDAKVRVRPSAFNGAGLEAVHADGGIVKHAQFACSGDTARDKRVFLHIPPDLAGTHNAEGDGLDEIEIGLDEGLEAREVFFRGESVWELDVVPGTAVEVFLAD